MLFPIQAKFINETFPEFCIIKKGNGDTYSSPLTLSELGLPITG
jgi:hypothetical protein